MHTTVFVCSPHVCLSTTVIPAQNVAHTPGGSDDELFRVTVHKSHLSYTRILSSSPAFPFYMWIPPFTVVSLVPHSSTRVILFPFHA